MIAKNSSSAWSIPSNQGSCCLAQRSECKSTGMPYEGDTMRTKCAPATAPSTEACFCVLSSALPAKKAAPPSENWIMIGRSSDLAASSTALHVDVDVQLNAGIAYPFAFACLSSAHATSPVTTPASIPGTSFHELRAAARSKQVTSEESTCWSGLPRPQPATYLIQ